VAARGPSLVARGPTKREQLGEWIKTQNVQLCYRRQHYKSSCSATAASNSRHDMQAQSVYGKRAKHAAVCADEIEALSLGVSFSRPTLLGCSLSYHPHFPIRLHRTRMCCTIYNHTDQHYKIPSLLSVLSCPHMWCTHQHPRSLCIRASPRST